MASIFGVNHGQAAEIYRKLEDVLQLIQEIRAEDNDMLLRASNSVLDAQMSISKLMSSMLNARAKVLSGLSRESEKNHG